MNNPVNYGVKDIFDGRPYYVSDPSHKVSLADEEDSYFGSFSFAHDRKYYYLEMGKIRINTSNMHRNEKAAKVLQAIMDFISHSDVYQNAFKIKSISSVDGFTIAYFEAYVSIGNTDYISDNGAF
jgi:hypothetical protein